MTKIKVYQACVLSTLLYGSESWTTYARHEKRLDVLHMRCLRKILGLTWKDKVPNTEVLERANLASMPAILCKRRLRWLGHVRRMNDDRLPKQVMYGELADGKRKRGRPVLRYKDVCKSSLQRCGIAINSWEEKAQKRDGWREAITCGTSSLDTNLKKNQEDKRKKRKERPVTQHYSRVSLTCTFCGRCFSANIGRISHERRCGRN